MKKFINLTTFVVILCMLATMACGCSGKNADEEIVDESVVTEASEEETTTTAEATSESASETTAASTTAATTAATTVATTAATTAAGVSGPLTDEMALDGIHTYCVMENPENVNLGADHWYIESSNDNEIVVLFIAYTGAEIRYYVNRSTGETHVTEFVEGIHDEEQPSDVHFNVRDHIAAEIYG